MPWMSTALGRGRRASVASDNLDSFLNFMAGKISSLPGAIKVELDKVESFMLNYATSFLKDSLVSLGDFVNNLADVNVDVDAFMAITTKSGEGDWSELGTISLNVLRRLVPRMSPEAVFYF